MKRLRFVPGIGILLIVTYVVWSYFFGLEFSLGRYYIPPYPGKEASLRQVLEHYTHALAQQGKYVEIRVLDEEGYYELRDVGGIDGNAYICLSTISLAFDTEIDCSLLRVITVHGVGSLSPRKAARGYGTNIPTVIR